ncbi:ICE2-domain-containing protein [Dipodascopsis tothii]|uniref:ICE2-domain-containing protein n=1 Tax=Dipodascopsis tothii TaxID=44089 RepID=UPI0034CF188E
MPDRMSPLWYRLSVLSTNAIYLVLIIFTIPLAFDVGGEECGLAFTLTLLLFYSFMATLRLLAWGTKLQYVTQLLYYSQHVIIPSLFILFLNIYSSPEHSPVVLQKIIVPWRFAMQNSTAGFAILEGFCTLLVIQAIGQISRWLVNNKSDYWMITLLITSGVLISGALYFLWRIYSFPITIGPGNATLIGVVLSSSLFLGVYGVVSGKGDAIESSVLFAYVVYCLYETFTDFQVADAAPAAAGKPDFPPFPPVIMENYASVVASVASIVPVSFVTMFEFISVAAKTIIPSVVISLMYRLTAFYAAARIIPAISASVRQDSGAAATDAPVRTSSFFVAAYAPCVLIAVYTHLLMQHFGYLPPTTALLGWELNTWELWSWVNTFMTLLLYASETVFSKDTRSDPLTSHWKTE